MRRGLATVARVAALREHQARTAVGIAMHNAQVAAEHEQDRTAILAAAPTPAGTIPTALGIATERAVLGSALREATVDRVAAQNARREALEAWTTAARRERLVSQALERRISQEADEAERVTQRGIDDHSSASQHRRGHVGH